MSKASSWWGKRWAEKVALAAPEPIPRGRGRPRGARLRNLDATTGEATVEVTTASVLPYEVRIAVAPIPDAVWDAASAELSRHALFAAKLLAGELPLGIEEALAKAGGSLFPGPGEVRLKCNCPAGTSGCRHGAQAERTLAEAIDRDPFLLFDLRGRPRDRLLASLGVVLSGNANGDAPEEAAEPELPAGEFRKARGDLGALHFHIAEPEADRALLTRLGDPPGWHGPPALLDAVGGAVEAAARKARDIALAD